MTLSIRIDGLTSYLNNTPVAIHGFDFLFQCCLLIPKVYIMQRHRFKDSPIITFRVADTFQFPESEQSTQFLGIDFILLNRTFVDQRVLPRITGNHLCDKRTGYLGSPVCKIAFLKGQIFSFALITSTALIMFSAEVGNCWFPLKLPAKSIFPRTQ